LDGRANATAIEVINSFLNARSNDISNEANNRLHARQAANYLFAGDYEAAIEICTRLLIRDEGDSRYDYMLWCGEAFVGLNLVDTAAMYFNGVFGSLGAMSNDSRAARARQLLDQIAQE
jgi:hypothetical protein